MATPGPETKRQKVGVGSDKLEEDAPKNSLKEYKVQDLMQMYYGRLFPHQHMYKWLAYGNDGKHTQADASFFQRREFCFTLDGDIFARYKSFKDGNELREAIKQTTPAKIDIGPVYTCNPQERLKFGAAFQPVERELVFDIDLTDYDDVRTCGKDGHICNRCWPFMAVAVKIIDAGLRQDFGFQNILWVYSGRRGIHCWVCDPSARKLTDEQRSSIASYFAVYKGHENDRVKVALGSAGQMHPAVHRAVDMLQEVWEQSILPQQRLLEDEVKREGMLKYVDDEEADNIRKAWAREPAASRGRKGGDLDVNVRRWHILKAEVEKKRLKTATRVLHEIMAAHAYPRLDMEVSKKMNHLLKAPFCVHPKTGRVCIPLHPEQAFDFDPDAVPTIYELLEQLPASSSEADKGEEWRSTRLADSVDLFQDLFLSGCSTASRQELAARAKAAASRPDMGF